MKWVAKFTGTESRESGRELHRTFLALRTTEMPIICAIDGLCLGAGLEGLGFSDEIVRKLVRGNLLDALGIED